MTSIVLAVVGIVVSLMVPEVRRSAKRLWQGATRRLARKPKGEPGRSLQLDWLRDSVVEHSSQGMLTARVRVAFLPNSGHVDIESYEAVLEIVASNPPGVTWAHDGTTTVRGNLSNNPAARLDDDSWETTAIFTFSGLNNGVPGSILMNDSNATKTLRAAVRVPDGKLYKTDSFVI